MMDDPVIIFSQSGGSEQLYKHPLVLDLRKSYQVRHPAVAVPYPHDGFSDGIAFRLKLLPAPMTAPIRGKFLVRLPFPSVHMIKEIFDIPEHYQQGILTVGWLAD